MIGRLQALTTERRVTDVLENQSAQSFLVLSSRAFLLLAAFGKHFKALVYIPSPLALRARGMHIALNLHIFLKCDRCTN